METEGHFAWDYTCFPSLVTSFNLWLLPGCKFWDLSLLLGLELIMVAHSHTLEVWVQS